MELQVTITSTKGRKPVSVLVAMPIKDVIAKNYKPYRDKGVLKICAKRDWTKKDLERYGYTKVNYRVYDRDKIQKENAERYEAVKLEKFASGEWKPSKADIEKYGLTV